jgi:hypothetical protein
MKQNFKTNLIVLHLVVVTLLMHSMMTTTTLVQASSGAESSSQADIDVYSLEHSIDSGEFKEIGSINLRSIRNNQNTAQYQSHNSAGDRENVGNENTQQQQRQQQSTSPPIYATLVQTNNFDENTKQEIKSALRSQSGSSTRSVYRLRVCKRSPSKMCTTASFTYLKNLLESNFQMNLSLHTGVNNQLNSISIKTLKSNVDAAAASMDRINNLNIFASIQHIKTAQAPDTESYLEKIKKEIEQKEKGAQGDNQSFLSKYWIYIVPFLIIMFLMNIVNPDAGGASR